MVLFFFLRLRILLAWLNQVLFTLKSAWNFEFSEEGKATILFRLVGIEKIHQAYLDALFSATGCFFFKGEPEQVLLFLPGSVRILDEIKTVRQGIPEADAIPLLVWFPSAHEDMCSSLPPNTFFITPGNIIPPPYGLFRSLLSSAHCDIQKLV